MVEARFDAEGAETKRVLRAASVFGERFSARGVASLLGGGARLDKTAEALHRLAEGELITAAPGRGRDGDVRYTFHHALVREAAYASLTEPDRTLGHRLAGAWLESTGVEGAVLLAEHFQRGGEPVSAARWYRRAAEQALAADDLACALEHAGRGVSCGASGEELVALKLVEAEVHVRRDEIAVSEQRSVERRSRRATGTAESPLSPAQS
jgi:predicted ATPase